MHTSSYYSTSNTQPEKCIPSSEENTPIPILILNIKPTTFIESYRNLLKNKAGVYSFFNTVSGNQYIGSAKYFYLRLNEHLNNKKSNVALQKAFVKYKLDVFKLYIYEYFTHESKISSKGLTDLETSYILNFNFDSL